MLIKKIFLLLIIALLAKISFAIPPFFYFGELPTGDVNVVVKAITNSEFEIIGKYNPMNSNNITVIAFTNKILQEQTLKVKDRGFLASVLKVAVINENGKSNIYLLNPEYIFWAYLGDEMKKSSFSDPLMEVDNTIKDALEFLGTSPIETGGNISRSELTKYRYMIGMERFSDPVELKTFNSFNEGLKTINQNIGKGDTKLVYQLIDETKQTAVFGIGLLNNDKGEPNFLPIIGEMHAAALPYEIILQGKQASMLHGRYRIALHWPELSMVTFSKIMSTPSAIEDQLKALTL